MEQIKPRFYAGIGARKTPDNILATMLFGATQLKNMGFMLRSGHAIGADQAFERGADGYARIYLPWQKYNEDVPVKGNALVPDMAAYVREAAIHHPYWDNLSQGTKKLMLRNLAVILGSNLNEPAEFVICWTPKGEAVGGTAHGIRIAEAHNIPVFNLFHPDCIHKLSDYLWPE